MSAVDSPGLEPRNVKPDRRPAVSPLQRVFHRWGLGEVRSVERLSGGRLNRVARVNGEYVLRCREPHAITGSLEREAAVLPLLEGRIVTPPVVAHGLDEMLGEYLIQRWIPGQNLLTAWLTNPDVPTREWWIEQWIAGMKAIHEVRFAAPGEFVNGVFEPAASWQTHFENRFHQRVNRLMRAQGANRSLVVAAERYVRRHRNVLGDVPCCLVHRDLHFGNMLVDGPRVTAFLDFELAQSAPVEYELDAILRFLKAPQGFAPPEFAAQVSAARFASVWVRLKRGYPELFHAPGLAERLPLYALDHALSCLLQSYAGRWGDEPSRVALTELVVDILDGRYTLP